MTELERLEKLMKRLDRATAEAFLAYVATMKSPAMIREVERLITSGLIDDAINLVDSHIRKFAAVVPRNYTIVGESTVAAAEGTIRRIAPRIAISFDPAHPRAVAGMQRQSLDLINRIGNEQKAAIRSALTNAFQEGAGPRQAAIAFRDSIGLTEKQLQHVRNFRTVLENLQITEHEALSRGLRDRRFDGRIERAIASGEPLSKAEIDRMVAAYERKYIKYRTEVIARTESTRTLNSANREANLQVIDATGFTDEQVERTWNSTSDSRTRDSHRNMQVRVVTGIDTPYITGLGNRALHPLDNSLPAEDCIQCRCVETIRFKTEGA